MPHYIATYNESAIKKMRLAGIQLKSRTLAFTEDDLTTARIFFRRYVRNFFSGLKLHDMDFSLYMVPDAPPSRLGFLSDPDQMEQSDPGMCGRTAMAEAAP